jgi:hypothetical protein
MLLNILLFRNLLVAASLDGFNQYARHCSRYVRTTDNGVDVKFFSRIWKYSYYKVLSVRAPRVHSSLESPVPGIATACVSSPVLRLSG